ncbi:MAG: winged helix-turn-helix transcriptional regulator [Promethearchaeota archaeon]
MKFVISKKVQSKDYEAEILEYIKQNPGGVTITDIASGTEHSRNTVAKYISILENRSKIFRKKIGAYYLYFMGKQGYFPKEITISYYKAILAGLRKHFPDKEHTFKQIGREALQYIDFSFGPTIKRQMKVIKGSPIIKLYFEIFKNFYTSYDLLQPTIEISDPEIDETGMKAKYRFTKSEFLEDTDEFIYHFHMAVGIMEAIFSREIGRTVECNIEDIHISDKKEDSYIEISVDIK